MEKGQPTASYVLERMRVNGLPRAYVLGCRAQRVTVLSQQFRAFNLIWALFAENRLKAGDRVGVVGGGIAGLTAAAAAMLKGCAVVLTEERQLLMHLQRRNLTRLLHPNIYEWPAPGAERDSTDFPCMNWTADLAGQVVLKLDKEWAEIAGEHRPEVHMNTRVTAIEPRSSDGRLVLRNHNEWMSDPCDAVVVAVGFGVEPPAPGLTLHSYWENDNLEQSARGPQAVRRVFVSGVGDGGCIDVLRVKYSDFDHAKFAAAVSRLQELGPYKEPLLDIDRAMPAAGRSEYLRERYAKLNLPADLADKLGTLRTDTHVVLNGPDPSPLSPSACILHRVAIWSLVVGNRIEYRPGKVDRAGITSEGTPTGVTYWVPVPNAGGRRGFDALVLRHGPDSCLKALPEVHSGYAGIPEDAANDQTRYQMYPDDFFPARPPGSLVSGVRQSPGVPYVLNPEATSGSPSPLPMATEHSVEQAQPARLRPTTDELESALRIANIETLIRTLTAETRAENHPPASEAARQLDELLARSGITVPTEVWVRGHRALCDFELLVRERIQAGRGQYDLGRLHELVRRMERGPR